MSASDVLSTDLAWLAGILDGEGCFAVKRQIVRRTGKKAGSRTTLQLWIVLCNTSEAMVRRAEAIMRQIGAGPQPMRRVWKGDKATRWQYWLHLAKKADVLLVTEALLPYLTAKECEARVFVWYLRKACQVKFYSATQFDKAVIASLSDVKRNGGEAPAEVAVLLREVIPSQALEGSVRPTEGSREGVETRSPSPNSTDSHERPEPAVRLRAVR